MESSNVIVKGAKARVTKPALKANINNPAQLVEDDDDDEDYLPWNNVVNREEWDRTGTYIQPTAATGQQQQPRRAYKRVTAGKVATTTTAAAKVSAPSPKLRPKYARKSSNSKNRSQQQQQVKVQQQRKINGATAAATAASNSDSKVKRGQVPDQEDLNAAW